MKKIIWIGLLLALLAAGAFFYLGRGQHVSPSEGENGGGGGRRAMNRDGRPLPVQAAKVQRGDIDVTIDALGTITARNTAIVKARVSGQLQQIAFQEGQLIKAGGTLAEIDPRPYQAQLDQALGQLPPPPPLLANARKDLERYTALLKKDSIASQQVDNQEWLVRQYEGTVQNDQGLVDSARLQLDFTKVTAPIAGRLGLRQVDVGNYVQTTDTNGIAVVTQTQPINVVFAIPADKVGPVIASLHKGKGAKLAVQVFDRAGKSPLATGRLMSVDNQIDTTTGTVKLKAEFANRDERLYPNQFVNARLSLETQHDAVLAPTAAIQRGARGTFMYVVGEDGVVSVRLVQLGVTANDVVAVESGLNPGEQVVIDGADKLRDGARVTVATPGAGANAAGSGKAWNKDRANRSGHNGPRDGPKEDKNGSASGTP